LALNKRKVLEAARKHAQKGAKAKALKEYNKLLKADPRDAKLLLEVGDAYRRWGQAEEAIAQYAKVAQQYRQDGFDARAVAVFKQILNLDPKHYAAYVSLSELYQRMGLDSEAISALQTAADGYHKEGRKAEALDLLRQTAALDPTNTTSRLKVAELLRQEGMEAEALDEYKAVAEEFGSQNDRDQLITVQERILEIKPDEVETLSSLVRNLMTSGDLARAESFAVRALNASAEPVQYELLIELYAQAGEETKLADTTRSLAKLYRDRGDEDKARELMQKLPTEDVGSSSRLTVDVSDIAEPDLGDEELLDEEPFLSLADEYDPGPSLGEDDEIELTVEDPQPEEPVPSVAIPEGDPDQLLAEANVYLRYGKRDQAIASLSGVIAQEPNHRAALEKLGEAYADDGQTANAVDAWKRAAVQVREAGDGEALAVLKDRIAALDPAAAEQIGSIEVSASNPAEVALDLDVEVELDLDIAIDEIASSETQSGMDFDTEGDDFEIEIDDESIDVEAESGPMASQGSTDPAEPVDVATPESIEDEDLNEVSFELDMEAEDLADEPSESATEAETEAEAEFEFEFDDDLTSPPTGAAPEQSTKDAEKINEELEEAEFYLAQDMFDEAEEILKRILESVPDHPSAMLRIGEIAAARASHTDPASAEVAVDPIAEDPAESALDGSASDFDVTARLSKEEGEENESGDAHADVEVDLELDDDFDDLDDDEQIEKEETLTASAPEADDALEIGDEANEDSSSDEGEGDTLPTENVAASEEPAGDTFDLREALAEVLTDDEELPSTEETSGVLSTVEDGFGSIFSDFKKGVSETLEEGDYETRYDLGIAYREMELYEDAIGEFRFCLDSEARRFDSLYLMGICTRELSRFDDAVNHFEQALALPDIPAERLASVYFDLSFAQEGIGDIERACASLKAVLEIDASFPGANERLAELDTSGTTSPKLGEPGEGFESFDELFDDDDDDEVGDAAMIEAVPVEAFESFDDVVEDAETSPPVEEIRPEPDPDADSSSRSAKKSGRKRISFV
jgi:tetratricopeptide (TPR) repeat protein